MVDLLFRSNKAGSYLRTNPNLFELTELWFNLNIRILKTTNISYLYIKKNIKNYIYILKNEFLNLLVKLLVMNNKTTVRRDIAFLY